MADLTEIQASQSIKIAGAGPASGIEDNYADVDSNGNILTKDYADGVAGSTVPPVIQQIGGKDVSGNLQPISLAATTPSYTTTATVVRPIPFETITYAACAVAFVPAAAATDIFTITGSATKTIRIHRIRISGTTTSGSAIKFTISLNKRSSVDTGGTSTSDVVTPFDSNSPTATATVAHYTANPSLGTLVGTIRADTISIQASGLTEILVWNFEEPIILRGTSQQIAVNLNGATITGPIFSIVVNWSEA